MSKYPPSNLFQLMSSRCYRIDMEIDDQEHLLLDVSTADSCTYCRNHPALSEYVNNIRRFKINEIYCFSYLSLYFLNTLKLDIMETNSRLFRSIILNCLLWVSSRWSQIHNLRKILTGFIGVRERLLMAEYAIKTNHSEKKSIYDF